MSIVSTIFEVIGQAVSSFVATLTSAVNGITELFYVASDGTNPAHMTFLGTLLLIAAGVGIVYFCFRLIKGLVRKA